VGKGWGFAGGRECGEVVGGGVFSKGKGLEGGNMDFEIEERSDFGM
jgi:hypothetical protein